MSEVQTIGVAHGYWLSQETPGDEVVLGRWGLIMALGLSEMVKRGLVNRVVITAGHVWGDGYPSIGELTRKYMIMFGVNEKDIFVNPVARDTMGEISEGFNLAANNNLQGNYVEICASRAHKTTIEKILFQTKIAQPTKVIAMEDYFKEIDYRPGLRVLNRMDKIHYGCHSLYEAIKRVGLNFVTAEHMREMAENSRNKKDWNTPWPFVWLFATDDYRIKRRLV